MCRAPKHGAVIDYDDYIMKSNELYSMCFNTFDSEVIGVPLDKSSVIRLHGLTQLSTLKLETI